MPAHISPAMPHSAPRFMTRLAELLAATDRFVGWWGEHRAWPASEPVRIEERP